MLMQRGQPGGVDLHQPDVARAVAVAANGLRIEAGFGAGDGVEQGAADLVALCRIVPTGQRGEGGTKGEMDAQSHR